MNDADVRAVLDAYRSGWLTMGPRTQAFETAVGALLEAPHVVAVSSPTAALHLALLAVGVAPGDEVLVPALGSTVGAAAVRRCRATPVLVDVRAAADHRMDDDDAAAKRTPRTRAVVATTPPALDLPVVVDAGLGLAPDVRVAATTCFSLAADAPLAVGEGGLVVTPEAAVAAKVRSLRSHAMTSVTWDRHRGHAESYDVVDVGFNARLDEPRAALGLSRLARLADEVATRRAQVAAAREQLGELVLPRHDELALLLPDGARRDTVRATLARAGIAAAVAPSEDRRSCPVAAEAAARVLRVTPSDEAVAAVVCATRA